MKSGALNFRLFCMALATVIQVAGCGGGGGGGGADIASGIAPIQTAARAASNSRDYQLAAIAAAPIVPMIMTCADGAGYQCSGGRILKTENGIALTDSGVQVYGKSTSDLATPIVIKTGAFGFRLASGGMAEVRLQKDGNGIVSGRALILSDLGLFWDGTRERPKIIETFQPTKGRVRLNAAGALTFVALPHSSDLDFYDYAARGTAGTQQRYANNRYFPRARPSRCAPSANCPLTETDGLASAAGDWRTGGSIPDTADAIRVHGDGDVHAGDGPPDANGNPTYLAGGTGFGVPFPGSKGYRFLDNRSFQYSNLSSWLTQDTVLMHEWGGADEHNKNRRGTVTFGDVSVPAAIPTTGSATYSGIVHGTYARNAVDEPVYFSGAAAVTVDFSTRSVSVSIHNTLTHDAAGTPVPVSFNATTRMGAAGKNAANYLTGRVNNGALTGGVSGRYFGPVVATGFSGVGPAEIGGAFQLSNATSGQSVIGGFIARKE